MFGTYAEPHKRPQWGRPCFPNLTFRVVIKLIATADVSLRRAALLARIIKRQLSGKRRVAFTRKSALEYAAFKVNVCVVYPRVMRAYFRSEPVPNCSEMFAF